MSMSTTTSLVDIDVVGDFPVDFDKTIAAFRRLLPNAIVAATVEDMVEKILRRLRDGLPEPALRFKLKRLRIFGHSNGNYIALSRFVEAPAGKFYRNPGDLTPSCRKRALSADILGLGADEKFYYGGNENELRKLAGKFTERGWAELHACYLTPGFSGDLSQSKIGHDRYGLYLMKALARLWRVVVLAGSDKQNPTPGLEGEVFIVHPDGRVVRKPPPALRKAAVPHDRPSGIAATAAFRASSKPGERSCMSGHDPRPSGTG